MISRHQVKELCVWKVRNAASSRLGIADEVTKQQRPRNISEEIFEARQFIRSLELFSKESGGLFSLDATPVELDCDALMYIENGLENRLKYFKAFLRDSTISLPTLTITAYYKQQHEGSQGNGIEKNWKSQGSFL